MRRELGWLVEARDADGRIIWFGGRFSDSTLDANDAIRFARKEDALRMLRILRSADLAATAFCKSRSVPSLRPSNKWKRATVTEHEWVPPPKAKKQHAIFNNQGAKP